MRLKGKVALITGAASDPGLGRSIARRFAEEGAKLIVTDIDESGLQSCVDELKTAGADVFGMVHNVVDEDQWQKVVDAAVERFGAVHVLVNNAGIAVLKPILEFSEQDYDRQMDVNLRSVFIGCQKIIPVMAAAGGGSIINMSSVGALRGMPGVSVYGCAKAAVQLLSKSVAAEHTKDGIRCNSIHPGAIDTNIQEATRTGNQEALNAIAQAVPMKRMGKPVEVADCAVFLASDESSYVTASELLVDGGMIYA